MPKFIVTPAHRDPRFTAFAAGAWPKPRPAGTGTSFEAFVASSSDEPGWADRRVAS